LLHVEAVLPADVRESEFDDGAEDGASEPWAEMKGLTHAITGDLAKAGEGGLSDDGTEARLDGERLQELRGPHRFAESENAMRVIMRGDKVKPLMDVIAFEEAVGGELAAT
jgi:hypothetical protein